MASLTRRAKPQLFHTEKVSATIISKNSHMSKNSATAVGNNFLLTSRKFKQNLVHRWTERDTEKCDKLYRQYVFYITIPHNN